ncbi:MAG: hypothetical protein JST43_09275 [Bacteroidetes bacterium]|nr:hypothetical protein [Bacteroidota bacterium]MBS1539039.1 hypothetical protein [Bacteroidota bacterium]
MKLLAVTGLKEYQKDINEIFHRSGVPVYSTSKIIGQKDGQAPDLLDSWFSAGNEQFDSVLVFCFAEEEKVKNALRFINEYNAQTQTSFPIHAFIMPVEEFSHQ